MNKILIGEYYLIGITETLLKRKSEKVRAEAKDSLISFIGKLKKSNPKIKDYVKNGNPVIVLSCGCKKEFEKVPFRNLKCEHGNYFIEILRDMI